MIKDMNKSGYWFLPNSDARLRYGYIAALIAAAGIIAAVLLYGHTPTVSPHTTIAVQTSPTPAAAKLGVEITALRLSAAGYMLDLRYRIVDIKKAAALLDRKIAPYLIEQASGAKLMVPNTPKLGPLRQTRKPANNRRTNFIFFANPGRFIKAGDKVSLVVGDTKIDNLTVE